MADDPIEAIRQRWAVGSPGPWHWAGNPNDIRLSNWELGRGRCTVMDVVRRGMHGAQPRFNADGLMVNGADLVKFEATYRRDINGVDHPDAEKIARAPADIAALLAEVDRLRALKVMFGSAVEAA